VLTGPFSPLFGPFFRAKRAGPARLGPLRAGRGQKLKPAGSAGPARFWPGFTGPGRAGPGRPVWPSLPVGLLLVAWGPVFTFSSQVFIGKTEESEGGREAGEVAGTPGSHAWWAGGGYWLGRRNGRLGTRSSFLFFHC
jgi:hypothetical protein